MHLRGPACALLALVFGLAAGSETSAAAVPLPRWNPKAPENNQLLPAFSTGNVVGVLTAIGARYKRSGSDRAKPAFVIVFSNGRRALLTLSSCDRDGGACRALSIQSFWTKLDKAPPDRTARAIEQFNQGHAFATAFIAADGRPSLQRYLTADYGFVRGNLAVNLLSFAELAERFAADVLEPLERSAK